jgi:hypothetical protein
MNMNRIARRFVTAGVLIATLVMQSAAADAGRVIRSVAFPGMGQLGDNQLGRGVLYMGGEIVLLSFTVDMLVRKAACDRATEYDSVKVNLAQTYEEKKKYYDDWVEMNDKSDQAAMLTYVFGGAAAVWWAWNIVDAFLFEPKDKEEAKIYRNIKDNTTVSLRSDKAEISYRITF